MIGTNTDTPIAINNNQLVAYQVLALAMRAEYVATAASTQ